MDKYNPPFSITNNAVKLVSSITEKITKLDGYDKLNKMPILRKNNRINSIHSSLAIEANSLTLNQVRDIINGKIVIGPQKEIQEVKNAFDAYELINEYDAYKLEDLLKAHGLMSKFLIDDCGMFRISGEGVFDGDKCIFVAPPASMVAELMNDLFSWMSFSKNEIHPLILSSVFHYEFVFIHPFSDGNGRIARLWQNVILSKWKNVFEYIPVESQIKEYQSDYYDAINQCNASGDSTIFIEFMLSMIDKVLDKILKDIKKESASISVNVSKLLNIMDQDMPLSANEIMERLGIKSKENLRANYLNPAIENGLIKLTLPNKPTSKNQKYYK